MQLDVDVKIPGYGPRVVAALREAGLIERSLVSSMFPEDLDAMRACEPALRVGWSVPRVRRDYTTDMLTAIPALAILTGYRALLPRRVRAALSAGRFDAIMAHWRLVTPRLIRAVADGGGELYVWTVDDAAQIARLSAMGVDGIITNDPRLFGSARWHCASAGGRGETGGIGSREALMSGGGGPGDRVLDGRATAPLEAHHAAHREPGVARNGLQFEAAPSLTGGLGGADRDV